MRPVRVAVIGVGNMGLNHARVYSQLDGVSLCAVADMDAERARAAAARLNTSGYRDYREMLKSERLDAVSVVVPTALHKQVALDVIAAGKALLVEKPLAVSVAEADELIAAAEEVGVVLAVGHIERFNPAVRELKRAIDQGRLGAISSVVAKRVGVMPPQIRDANVVLDLGVHDIDVLNMLFGKTPDEVTATGGHALLTNRYDHAEIFMRYGEAGCLVQVNWITPLKIRTLAVTGNAGYAELNYVTQKLDVFEANLKRSYDSFGDFVVRFGEAARTTVPLDPVEPLRLELEDFVGAVAGVHCPTVPGSVGREVLEIVEWVQRALDEARPTRDDARGGPGEAR